MAATKERKQVSSKTKICFSKCEEKRTKQMTREEIRIKVKNTTKETLCEI